MDVIYPKHTARKLRIFVFRSHRTLRHPLCTNKNAAEISVLNGIDSQHRPAAILHADVVGSTALVPKDERVAHDRIQAVLQGCSV